MAPGVLRQRAAFLARGSDDARPDRIPAMSEKLEPSHGFAPSTDPGCMARVFGQAPVGSASSTTDPTRTVDDRFDVASPEDRACPRGRAGGGILAAERHGLASWLRICKESAVEDHTMSGFNERLKDALGGFYLTLVSVMQSLALGFLLQSAGATLLSAGRLPWGLLLQSATVLLALVLVWHQYAFGTVAFRWRLDLFDSAIPFAIGTSEYLMIAVMVSSQKRSPVAVHGFAFWLWFLSAFAGVSAMAYLNQSRKAERTRESETLIAPSRRSMQFTLAYCLSFTAAALVASFAPLAQCSRLAVSTAILATFLAEAVRIDRAYAAAVAFISGSSPPSLPLSGGSCTGFRRVSLAHERPRRRPTDLLGMLVVSCLLPPSYGITAR